MELFLDKIASVTKNIRLSHSVIVQEEIVPEEGLVIAAEVLEDKKIYNQLELVSGRLSTLEKGDIIAVALGNRRALRGFVGKVPEKLAVGDVIHVLNLGGVVGICTSENLNEVGHALKVKVLGVICDLKDNKRVLNIRDFALFTPKDSLESKVPLIVVSGTCMNVGKTSVACEVIKYGSRKGFNMVAAKLAGIAALKDTENMKDYGAKEVASFIDAGCTSTINNGDRSMKVAKGVIDYLTGEKPDYIVIEFGDGVFGEYGVMSILEDKAIQKNIVAHIGCAHDPMGAMKLAEVCAKLGAPLHLVSGPVTDNSVGTQFVTKTLNLPAINALYDGERLFDYLLQSCLKK